MTDLLVVATKNLSLQCLPFLLLNGGHDCLLRAFRLQTGCATCRKRPLTTRPLARWQPDQGRAQCVPAAPTYYPTREEFNDHLAYIERIRPEAEKYGICRIVPPEGWNPPFALEKGTDGSTVDSFRCAAAWENLKLGEPATNELCHLLVRAAIVVVAVCVSICNPLMSCVCPVAGLGPASS